MSQNRFGRKKKSKSEYNLKNFYWSNEYEAIWNEFTKVCKAEMPLFKYPERTKSIILRSLIMQHVLDKTSDASIQQMIIKYDAEEKVFIDKLSRIKLK